ncbi:MAG: alpha/beta hydrolase [Halocynthiibacter sp.]
MTQADTQEKQLNLPDEITTDASIGRQRFRVIGESSALWYEGQPGEKGKNLVISFDNLATINEEWPRLPWMHWRIAKLGYSNLGVQSFAKDWFRLTDAAELLTRLQQSGFFDQFERVVLIGASMGGFAALNYAQLIPNSTVMAFSAQSTMSKDITPFEQRFPFAVRKSNWTDEPYLDATKALPGLRNAFLFFDPHVPEDAAHAKRMQAPNVEQVKCAYCTHEAIRVFILSEAFFPLLQGVVEENRITADFWKAWRKRRNVRKWARGFLDALPINLHPQRSYIAAKKINDIKDMSVARQLMKKATAILEAQQEYQEKEPVPAPMRFISIDSTKATMGAMTMVGGDHFFLKRWVDYYGAQLGREHLYVLSHGGDPEHKKIAEGCNIIYLPHDPTRYCFNQRRWQMLSHITSAFTRYYNWFLTGDVDEIVAVDPAVHSSLPEYISRFEKSDAPRVITPFAIEMVHNPTLETRPLSESENILKHRRLFRMNANYAKPCISRDNVTFAPGGHFANHNKLFLDPHLYLFHLRFIDHDMTAERLATRRAQRTIQSGALDESERATTGWDTAWDTYMSLSREQPLMETIEFAEFRQEMVDGWRSKKKVFWAPGGARPKGIYRLPKRFSQLF